MEFTCPIRGCWYNYVSFSTSSTRFGTITEFCKASENKNMERTTYDTKLLYWFLNFTLSDRELYPINGSAQNWLMANYILYRD